ncbi:hypothetical protein [Streptomyces smyrnaeus]|uniref:hypothetical protein n=1 Tax=Streptomyces smyrnaeus TaxID=1387713 RepID=UPI001FD820E9|nr:hypothetical protein [Streptomyces smyrnaeus]
MNISAARRTAYAGSALWTVCAVFAALTAAVTALPPHRTWGALAAVGYAVLALVPAATVRSAPPPVAPAATDVPAAPGAACRAGPPTRRQPRHRWLTGRLPLAGCALTAVLPLLVLAFTDSAQEEVHVVHRAGARLLAHGTPYLSPDQLAGADYTAYNPYLPGMALFGVPRQLLGLDARFGFAAAFLLTFALSLRTAGLRTTGGLRATGAGPGARGSVGRRTLLLTASPLIALPLAVGGDDLPVLGLLCLGLALAGRHGRAAAGRSGLVLGVACTLKATAWPALPVVAALLAVREGRPAVLRLTGGAAPALAAGLALPVLVDGAGLAANAIRYPLGLAEAASPAAAPLPGRLLAALGPAGQLCAVVALVLAALLIGGSLLPRPPRDAGGAALRLALGLLMAMALLPASRFGYAVYPAVLALWAYWRNLDARRLEPGPGRRPPAARRPTARRPAAPWGGAAHPDREPGLRPHRQPLTGPHADRDERLPAPAGRHRDVRPRDRTPLPTR